jgi:signal transduction histidine kinase
MNLRFDMTDPVTAVAVVVALVALAAGSGFLLRTVARRFRSLRLQIMAIVLGSLVMGLVAALALVQLMVLTPDALVPVMAVLALIVPFVVGFVVVSTQPIRHDAARIETTLNRLEAGDHGARVDLNRDDEFGRVAALVDRLGTQLEQVNEHRRVMDRERAGMDAERRILLSSISHDLRTPIGALQAAVEALNDGVADDPRRYLRSMGHDLTALSGLVDDLFLLSQLDAGLLDVRLEPVDLAELADEAAEALAPTADSRRVTVQLTSDRAVPVLGNGAALGRVIRNLLDNAIRHTPSGSAVHLLVEPGNPVRLMVTDEGPGFPPEFVPHAFDRFARPDPSRTRTTGGTGLGLAIAKGLVEAHGGSIRIEPGPGGRLAVELPTPDTLVAQPS